MGSLLCCIEEFEPFNWRLYLQTLPWTYIALLMWAPTASRKMTPSSFNLLNIDLLMTQFLSPLLRSNVITKVERKNNITSRFSILIGEWMELMHIWFAASSAKPYVSNKTCSSWGLEAILLRLQYRKNAQQNLVFFCS